MGRSVASQQVDALASDGMRAESVIDRTPDELLLKIFDFYRLGSPRPYKTGWVWEWPLLAQVCRRWHGLVLSSPNRLKTMDFHFTHGAPVADILPRLSPTSALSIDYWDEAYDDDEELILWSEEDIDGVLLALEQSDRITDVRLFGTTETLESIFESMTQPAPKLQSLKVQAAIDDPSPVFPFNFLGGSASALRNLELTGIIPPLPSTPCLTRLEVNLEDFHADLFALHEFVGHICAMPQLETLILSVSAVLLDEDEDAEDQITPNGAPATLSALSTISLRGLGAHLEALVCRILAPQLEVLEVQFTDHSDMTAIPSLANFIRSSTKLHAPGMAHLGLSGDGGFIKTYPSPEDRQRSPLSFSFRYMEPGVLMASVASICNSLTQALSSADTLIVQKDMYPELADPGIQWAIRVEEWHMILAVFAKTRYVKVENVFTLGVTEAMKRPGGTALLPNLHELEFLFYSTDGYNTSDILKQLEPFIAAHHTSDRLCDVCCRTIPSGRQYRELKDGNLDIEMFLNGPDNFE